MRTLTSDQLTSIQAGGTTLARIAALTLVNGTVLRFTDCDFNLVISGNTYLADFGFTASAIQVAIGTSPQSATFTLPLFDAGVTRAMVEGGALDNADFIFSIVDWSFPSRGKIDWFEGVVTKAEMKDAISVDLTCEPILNADIQISADQFQTNCRADLGDDKCKVDIDALKKTFTVASVSNVQVFTTDLTDADAAWNNGLVVWATGPNAGLAFEVGSYVNASGTITLQFVVPFLPTTGDTGTVYPGCDKTPVQCFGTYDNMVNFRGENTSIQPIAIAAPAAG